MDKYEFNSAIARVVFGYAVRMVPIGVLPTSPLIPQIEQDGRWVDCPDYWWDMNAAFQVVFVMRGRGFHLQMNDTLSAYRARFFTVDDTREWDRQSVDGAYYEFSEQPGHAIGLAALRALKG